MVYGSLIGGMGIDRDSEMRAGSYRWIMRDSAVHSFSEGVGFVMIMYVVVVCVCNWTAWGLYSLWIEDSRYIA